MSDRVTRQTGSRSGLTLVEVLAVLALLSVLAVAVTAWTGSLHGLAGEVSRRSEQAAVASNLGLLLRRDTTYAMAGTAAEDQGALRVVTSHAPLAGSEPGWRLVRWAVRDSGSGLQLVRISSPVAGTIDRSTETVILGDVRTFRVVVPNDEPRVSGGQVHLEVFIDAPATGPITLTAQRL